MSETPKETAPAEAKPDAAAKPAPAGPALPLLLGAAGGALVAGAVLGLFVIGPMVAKPKTHAAGATAEAGVEAEPEAGQAAEGEHGKGKGEGKGKSTLFQLDNVIVNPAGSQGSRFVMATVAFEVPDEKASEALREREVQLRDRVISVIESETLESLTLPGARDTLRSRISNAVAPVLKGATSRYDVYLPAFVIQ